MFDIQKNVIAAEKRIRPYIRETVLDYSVPLSKQHDLKIYLKCENLQHQSAFKTRGAFNKLLSLTPAERQQGVVTASSGNHGAAIAFAATQLNIPAIVFVPQNVSPTKADNIRNYNVQLEFYSNDCMQAEIHARQYAQEHNLIYVSPYNDLEILSGQGTIAIELEKQLSQIDAIFVPVGGGGLIAGIAGYIKSVSPHTKVIGCLPKNSPVMARSIQAGKIIEMETLPTLSDATAGGIEQNSITFPLCQQFVDDYILVSEQEIQNAIITLFKTQHLLIEGASGVALASLFQCAKSFKGKNTVAILSGGNLSLDTFKSLVT